MQVSEFIGYNHVIRQLYLNAMEKLQWSDIVGNKSLSFGSIRNVFVHLTMVEDRWINYIIPGRFKDWIDPDFDSYRDMALLKNYAERIRQNTEAYLSNLSTEELAREIVAPWGKEPGKQISVEKALMHMVFEDMIHYGELSAALWQMGLEAPYFGFWRYSLQKV